MPSVTVAAIIVGGAADANRKIALTALASQCRPVVVPDDLPGLPVEIAKSDNARAGLETALSTTPHIDAALFLRGDQPSITAGSIRRLLEAFQRTHLPIAAAWRENLPALFSRTLFSEVLRNSDPAEVIRNHRTQVARVRIPQDESAVLRVLTQ